MNNRGSIFFALIAPLLIVTLAVAAATTVIVLSYKKNQTACRAAALSTQQIQALGLTALMSLNPKAKYLRLKQKIIEAAIAVAMATPGAQGQLNRLFIELKKVKFERIALDKKQKILIASANSKATHEAHAIRSLISSAQIHPSNVRLQVIADQKNTLAPVYTPVVNFDRRQAVRIEYVLYLSQELPAWLQRWLRATTNLKLSCRATIQKKEEKWLAVLSEDKSSWKSP